MSTKTQIRYIAVAILNFSYTLLPFFFLRKFLLRLIGIKIGKRSYIHRGVKFFHFGKIIIGDNTTVNFNCYLDNRTGIFIGNNVGIAHNTKIYTLGHDINDSKFSAIGAKVRINDHVFIFSNCLIMPGVTIGEGAIVLAGSVVTKNVDPYTVVGGNPAKYIKNRPREINYSRDYGYWFAS